MAALKPDFSHRMAHSSDPIENQLVDTIGLMAGRANGALASLTVQFEDTGASTINNELLSSALYAVEAEVNDMLAVVSAYWDALKAHQAETKNTG